MNCRSLWADYLTDNPRGWRVRVGEHHMFSDVDQDQVDVDVENIIIHPNRNRKRSSSPRFGPEIVGHYGPPFSVAWATKSMLYSANVIFACFLWPPYAPAQVNGGSGNFYTWWILSVNTCIFSRSSLNYRVAKKWRNLAHFQTPPANFLLSRPNEAEYCNSEKKWLSTDGCCTRNATFRELWRTNPWDPRATLLFCDVFYFHS